MSSLSRCFAVCPQQFGYRNELHSSLTTCMKNLSQSLKPACRIRDVIDRGEILFNQPRYVPTVHVLMVADLVAGAFDLGNQFWVEQSPFANQVMCPSRCCLVLISAGSPIHNAKFQFCQ
jgi:hypothetical protein